MHKNICILLAGLFFVVPSQLLAEKAEQVQKKSIPLNLEQTVETGLERSPRIQGAEFGIKGSQAEVRSARGKFLPRATASYRRNYLESIRAIGPSDEDYMNQTQDTWTLSVVQTLFAGKTNLNSYQIAKIEEESSRVEKEAAERELIQEIQEQFLQLLKMREDRRSLEDTIERLKVSRDAAQAFYERQMAPFVEVLQAEVDLEDARQELSQVKNEETIHKTKLNRLLDYEAQRGIEYQGNLEDIDLEQEFQLENCLQKAKKQRTELEFVENNIKIAAKEKDIALGRLLPRVELEASYVDRTRDYDEKGSSMNPRTGEEETYDRDQQNQYWSAGINVEWQFFSGGQQYYRSQSMEHEVYRLRKQYKDTVSQIATEVRSAYLRLQEARERVEASRKTLETAQENYEMQQERFKRRVSTLQDLLNAQDRLTRSDANHNQALLDYQLALAELYFAMGERNYSLS
ncbi:MAG: TolC family protein [Desulfohalobiaceae bacterium]